MYAVLNQSINPVLDKGFIERDLQKYSSIMTQFRKGPIVEDDKLASYSKEGTLAKAKPLFSSP